jgi:hypothetical protein
MSLRLRYRRLHRPYHLTRIFKTTLAIIDDLIGSKLFYKIHVGVGRRGDHICPLRFCKLNSEESYRASTAMDEGSFSLL